MPPIVLLTDFGTQDHYVGVVKGVILSIQPQVPIVDLSHAVPPYEVAAAQFLLGQALPYFPAGTVYLVIVDPGVGSARRPIALRTPASVAVGPDNGVLQPLFPQLQEVVQLHNPTYWRTPSPSHTFHGRDIFAPVAAHICRGVPLAELGTPLDPATLVTQPLPSPLATPSGWRGHIQYIDHFGNLISTIPADHVPLDRIQGILCAGAIIPWGTHYGAVPVGHLVALPGSHGYVEIACHQGHAAKMLGARIGEVVEVQVRSG